MKNRKVYMLFFIIFLILFSQQSILCMSSNDLVILQKALNSSGAENYGTLIHIIFYDEQSQDNLSDLLYKANNFGVQLTINKNSNNQIISLECNIKDVKNKLQYINSLKEYLDSLNIQYHFITLIKGQYEKSLTTEDMNKISDEILEEVGGKKVEGGWINSQLLSISGYSPSFNENIITGGNKININIVMSYNNITEKNEIIVATPIVNEDY